MHCTNTAPGTPRSPLTRAQANTQLCRLLTAGTPQHSSEVEAVPVPAQRSRQVGGGDLLKPRPFEGASIQTWGSPFLDLPAAPPMLFLAEWPVGRTCG